MSQPDGFTKNAPVVPVQEIGRLAKLLAPALERAGRRQRREELPVPSQWRHLNDTLGGGLWPGNHFLVAGTGVGKSQMTFQMALNAAKEGVPTGLIALELDEMSLAIRIAAEEAGVVWSKVYNGQASDSELARVAAVVPMLASLPIRTDFGQAMGWGYDRLEMMAKALRAEKKTGPVLIVLDFIQLIAMPAGARPVDLRERIGLAGYQARNVAKTYDASIVIISSTARQNYGALNSKMSKAGLGVEKSYTSNKLRRCVRYPDNLIGLGKESGELEFSADSLTVLMRPQITQGHHDAAIGELVTRGAKIVVCATPKVRAGIPSWFAMSFERGRFAELPEDSINSLCTGDGDDDADNEEPAERVLAAIEEAMVANPLAPIKGKTELGKLLKMRRQVVSKAVDDLVAENRITSSSEGLMPTKPL